MVDEQTPKSDPEEVLAKTLLNEYRQITDYSKKEIAWVQSAYKLVAALITVIFVAGTIVGYRSLSEFMTRQEQSISNRMKVLEDNVNATIQSKVIQATTVVEDRIDREFKQENIQRLVEERAQTRIDVIADPLIEKKISLAVQPKIEKADQQLEAVKTELTRAQATVKQLESLSEYLSTVLDAQNDDRMAFDKLRTLSEDKTSPFREKAGSAWMKIMDDHAQPFYSGRTVPWSKDTDPSKLTLAEIEELVRTAPAHIRVALVEFVSKRTDFPKAERMAFMVRRISGDRSLNVVEFASRFFVADAGISFKPLATREILDWWEKNKGRIK